ncbi:MAG: lysylphosphatidylglycerol synthase transmembrane domain-containing protein [Thiobacillus sp.]
MKKWRIWLNIITIALLVLAVYLGRHQVAQAWGLIGKVNLWLFMLIIPIQFLSYYAVGEVMFSYLRDKKELKNMSRWAMARTALELNFVNHIIPIPTFAGFSYLGWILGHYGVSAGRATMAQLIRYVTLFVSFLVMIILSIVVLFFDIGVDKRTIFISEVLVIATIVGLFLLIYFIGSKRRLIKLSRWLTNFVNRLISAVTFGKKRQTLKFDNVQNFMVDLHQDYLEINADKKILVKPLLWAVFANILDVLLIEIAFMALGTWVNPAVLAVAYGIAAFVAIFAATPGGSGVYEAIMIAFIVAAGVPAGLAIAGTLLARVTLFAGTILFGYISYQLSINKYGKISDSNIQR